MTPFPYCHNPIPILSSPRFPVPIPPCQVRSIVLSQQEEIQSWVKFASICRRSDKMALSERTLRSILSHDPAYTTEEPLSDKYPSVSGGVLRSRK